MAPGVVTTHAKPVVTKWARLAILKKTIGGFIVVKADLVEEAVEFAKGRPVLQVKAIVWR